MSENTITYKRKCDARGNRLPGNDLSVYLGGQKTGEIRKEGVLGYRYVTRGGYLGKLYPTISLVRQSLESE